jgi:hypothetical protein
MNSIQKVAPGLAATPRQKRWTLARLCLMLTTIPMLLAACRPQAGSSSSPVELRSDRHYRWTITRLKKVTPEYQHDWLDNRTILFIGSDESKTSGLYAWDQKSPARLVLADAYRLCFDGKTWRALVSRPQKKNQKQRHFRYLINPTNLSTTKIGAMPHHSPKGYANFYTCNEEPYPQGLNGHIWRYLHPNDGYLDLGIDQKQQEEAALISKTLSQRVLLGFRVNDPRSIHIHFNRHGGVYILYDMSPTSADITSWKTEGQYTIHTLTPSGGTRGIAVHSGPWSEVRGGDRAIRLAKPGIIVSSKGGAQTRRDSAGVYLIRNDKSFSRLDNGLIDSPSVSPDGCNVAYRRSVINHFSELTSINVCSPYP